MFTAWLQWYMNILASHRSTSVIAHSMYFLSTSSLTSQPHHYKNWKCCQRILHIQGHVNVVQSVLYVVHVLPPLVVYTVHGANTLQHLHRDYCWFGNHSNRCKQSNPPVLMVQLSQKWQVCSTAGTLGEGNQSMCHDHHMGPVGE